MESKGVKGKGRKNNQVEKTKQRKNKNNFKDINRE
jgi:hypothetical protein